MKAVGPYGLAAGDYLAAGWSPLPLPPRKKEAPPRGWTGGRGAWVDGKQMRAWLRSNGAGNIAVRVATTVIGFDVDTYGSKTGRSTLRQALRRWGPLPATWVSTARPDTDSGIRWYRIPEGLSWPGEVGKGVEIIRWDHRYAIVMPSVHPEGREYVWVSPDGVVHDDEFPAVDDLPALPQKWIAGLTEGKPWVDRPAAALTAERAAAWLSALPGAGGTSCEALEKLTLRGERLISEAAVGSAHEAARDIVWGMVRDAARGHRGVSACLHSIGQHFIEEVTRPGRTGRRTEASAVSEWHRMVDDAIRKVAAQPLVEAAPDPCELYADNPLLLNDDGNARRLVTAAGEVMKFVPALGGWHVCDVGGLWVNDQQAAMRHAKAVATAMYIEAQDMMPDNEAQGLKLAKWAVRSGDVGKLKAMLGAAESLPGVALDGGLFDAVPGLLACGNGVVELRAVGDVGFRPIAATDMLTLHTPVPYEAGARSALWDEFLDRFIPDLGLRAWIQKLVGYTLLGHNPERLMIICFGPTSTGKTTFAETLRAALGGHAGLFNLSMFRDNQDERPRSDLVDALSKRFIVAEEASSDWYLHSDMIKRLTGGTGIKARRVFAPVYIERVPAFTPWMVTNNFPTIEGADQALYRRLVAVPFSSAVSKDEEVGTFAARLRALALPAVLAWAVRGWEMYVCEGLADVPLAAAEAALLMRGELSDLDVFLSEACEFGGDYCALSADLYKAYVVWCEQGRIKPESSTKFGRHMTNRGHARGFLRVGDRDEDQKARVRLGLRLNAGWATVVGGES